MKNSSDYFNLLTDTLRNGYHQIISIYNKLQEARNKSKFINIRTTYLMQKENKDKTNYFFPIKNKYPLCYCMSCRGGANVEVILKLFEFYNKCLDNYGLYGDAGKIKGLVNDEIERAKSEYQYNFVEGNGKDDLALFKEKRHENEPKTNDGMDKLSDEEEEELSDSDSLREFIDSEENEDCEEGENTGSDVSESSDKLSEFQNKKLVLLGNKRGRDEESSGENDIENDERRNNIEFKLNNNKNKVVVIDDDYD